MINSAQNSADMKFQNRKLILNLIRKEPISRAELARRTGLTRAAVSIIVDELIAMELVFEIGTAKSDFGRKPVLLDINPNSYYILGFDISRSHYTISIVNMKGVVIKKRKIELSEYLTVTAAIKKIVQEIRNMVDNKNLPFDKILGLGVSAPGPLDVYKGIILNPPNFDLWKEVNIVDILKEEFSFEIYLENNSVALALAEKIFGVGKMFRSSILLVVDTGVGAGIIINDELYRGVGGFGSEVGHTSINIDGKVCSCGNRGCLEVYASIPAILTEARKIDRNITSWNHIVDRALNGDKLAKELIDKEARYLSAGIVNSMNILELEAVVLTGYVLYKPELLLERIRYYVHRTSITRDKSGCDYHYR